MNYSFRLLLLITYVGILSSVINILYYSFINYNINRIIGHSIAAFILVHVNKSLQGGK
jgi:hypothetical protein